MDSIKHGWTAQSTRTHKSTSKIRNIFRKRATHVWRPQPDCRLLRLPGELRNKIYHLVLVVPNGEENDPIENFDPHPHRVDLKGMKLPALAATCRQIQHEALSYFFRFGRFTYKFSVDDKSHLHYRIGRPTKRWMKATSAYSMIIHDVVIGVGCVNTFHLVGAKCPLVDPEGPCTPPWYNTVYYALELRLPRSPEGYTVKDVKILMTQWMWAPRGRALYTIRHMILRGACMAGKMRLRPLAERLRTIARP